MRHSVLGAKWLVCVLLACTSSESTQPAPASPVTPPAAVETKPAADVEAKAEMKAEVKAEPTPAVDAPPEIPIQPWSTVPHAASWTLRAEPDQFVALVLDLYAGVLGRAGDRWVEIGKDGKLATVAMDREPNLPVVGVWPSDAWFVDERMRKMDATGDLDYQEIRLMKLRGGDRWVPQMAACSGGEQWFHPGTADWYEPHMSTLSGMLMYTVETFSGIERVAGKHDAPELGRHRGPTVRGFLETGKGEVYVLSEDADGTYAVGACSDDDCVRTSTRKLPGRPWMFGRRVARGKHAVSVIAMQGAGTASADTRRGFILHFRGKDGWLLDELPAGEQPNGMWASEEGGLWTLTGDRLRWRDTESVWHDVALPDGLRSPTAALSEDRKSVFVSGVVGEAAKIFSTDANGPAPAR